MPPPRTRVLSVIQTRVPTPLLLTLLFILTARSPAQHYDLILRNGHILDGTGSPWYAADIAILDGRIAAIGTLPNATAARIIDTGGLTIAPGFIDMLGQADTSLFTDPHIPSKLFQGITTEITGEGVTVAPITHRTNPQTQFRTFADYFQRLESQGIALNLASYVGATTIRHDVLGSDPRAPSPAELAQMQQLVLDAMHDGAIGLSTSLMYAPAAYASTDELIALASTAAGAGGIYATHLRSEGDHIDDALDETFRIAREAHISVEIFHLKAAGVRNWGTMPHIVQRIDDARAAGLDIAADTYAYTVSGNAFSALLPPWAHAGGDTAMVARLKDPAQRALMRSWIVGGPNARTWDNEWLMLASPAGLTLASTPNPRLAPLQGKTLAEIAAQQHKDPIDTIFDLLIEDPNLHALLATMSEPDVVFALKQPWVSIGLDATGVPLNDPHPGHPRAFAAFPRILASYVREEHVLTLPDAIRKFTALPAARLHLAGRGVLKAGMWADIVVFDPTKIAAPATFDHPNQLATGMAYVLVNGVPVIDDGKLTPALPGKILRGPACSTTSTSRTSTGP